MKNQTLITTQDNPLLTQKRNQSDNLGESSTDQQSRKIRILSIDGGGIRGIIPATILTHLEQLIQKKTGNENARLSDYFDMMAGTSTGGILTCAYLTPNPENNGRPMTSQEALDLYLKFGKDIFSQTTGRKWKTLFGLLDEKYKSTALEKLLKQHFTEGTRLSQMLKPCLITSYDITTRRAMFFNKLNAVENHVRDFDVWEIARATSAAPTYFEPAFIDSENDCNFPLIDGGLVANNPAMCAFVEAHKTAFSKIFTEENAPDYPDCSNMVIVSISTGSVKRSYTYDKMRKRGAAGWIKPVIDIMMSANSETVDYQLQQLFNTCQDPTDPNYFRLKPNLHQADSAIDNVSSKNLEALHQAGLQYISKNVGLLDQIADKITAAEVRIPQAAL